MTLAIVLFLLQSHVERAQALLREQRIEEAQKAVAQALAEQPDSVPALLIQGRIAIARGDSAAAREAFTRAASLSPSSPQAHFMLGFFHYLENDFTLALPALRRARELAPKDSRTALFLALTFEGLANAEQAEALFQETLRLERQAGRPSVESHVAFARLLFAQGRFAEAQTQVSKALALKPDSRNALYEQARLELERGGHAACIEAASKALKEEGDGVSDRQIHFLLSRAYARAGNQEMARRHRELFESIPPRLVR